METCPLLRYPMTMKRKTEKTTGDQPSEPQETEQPEDEVDEAGEESFPASDPPAWNAAVAH